MRCDTLQERIHPYLDDELDPAIASAIDAHLGTCRRCAGRVAAERALLRKVSGVARERAPAPLRARVSRLLDGVRPPQRAREVRPRAFGWRRLVPLAAAVGAILLIGPGSEAPDPLSAAGFAADHAAHAASAPSRVPFDAGIELPPPPALGEARLQGLSRCVIDGVAYAHYAYTMDGRALSVYLPVRNTGRAFDPERTGAGDTAVLSVQGTGGRTAVLVSGSLSVEELARLIPGG